MEFGSDEEKTFYGYDNNRMPDVHEFTDFEAYTILRDLMENKKADKRIYVLICLWLAQCLKGSNNKRPKSSRINKQVSNTHGILKHISGGFIHVNDYENNKEKFKELVHVIILHLISDHQAADGRMIGLRHKISWDTVPIKNDKKEIVELLPIEGNWGRVVSFIHTCVMQSIFVFLGALYRPGIKSSAVSYLKGNEKSKDRNQGKLTVQTLKERLKNEEDKTLRDNDLIRRLNAEGYTDAVMYQYRMIHGTGDWMNYFNIPPDMLMDHYCNKQKEELSNDNHTKEVYEEIFSVLNSNLIPLEEREFLKAYHELPCVSNVNGKTKMFNSSMPLFYMKFPHYKEILKVKRVHYVGSTSYVKYEGSPDLVKESDIYKRAHAMLKKVLEPRLKKILEIYEERECNSNDLDELLDTGINGNMFTLNRFTGGEQV